MSELAPDLRNQLARVIVKARTVAEAGARKALGALAVDRHEPHSSMSPDERKLRNRLRARGRQLGDVRDRQRGSQSIDKLVHEVAYEHWHRMLFARFLSENGLLIHPEHKVALSSAEIEELARETGDDPHRLAARFAQDSLPQIFRADDPVLEVTLAPESRQRLESLLDSLPVAVYTADDSLGWTYQYWQAEKKDAVNASGVRIGADELPAVTQLFTEHYMVMFLYHNTLGAWHAGKVLSENPSIAETAKSEDELRSAVALKTDAGDSNWDYLRFVREPREGDEGDSPTGPWRPAAGTFEGWPRTARELKVLDPCCGSGHFLVAGFKLLVRLRMFEEGLALDTAINAVLRDNLFGLELEPRCTQIAAFNLAIAAWRWVGKPIELPSLNIACAGLSIGSSKKDWIALAGDDESLSAGLAQLYDLFRQAPELGSLIDPKALGYDLFVADFDELQPLIEQALTKESDNAEVVERAVVAQGMAKAAEILANEYTLVITNVPYLLKAKQPKALQLACNRYCPDGSADLATVFMQRSRKLCQRTGCHATVTPQNWLFLGAYRKFRRDLLNNQHVNHIAKIGSGATATASWDVLRCLAVVNAEKPTEDYPMTGIEALGSNEDDRAAWLRAGHVYNSLKSVQLANPDERIIPSVMRDFRKVRLLSSEASSNTGLQTGDNERFAFAFWERPNLGEAWELFQRTVAPTQHYAGCSQILRWEQGNGTLVRQPSSTIRGIGCVGKLGVLVHRMGKLPATIYTGQLFDQNGAVLLPKRPETRPAIWCYVASEEYRDQVRRLDGKLGVTPATLAKVPFDLVRWQRIADEKYPNGLPEPQSDDPIQWLFHGHPARTKPPCALHVSVGRLLGYRWPPEHDSEMRLADDAREWVDRCGQLLSFADDDGIVCLPALRSEPPAAEQLRRLLSTAFGENWSAAKERELLLAATGEGNKPATSLEVWLRDRFFEEHCKLFHHRPFIWHIWDGTRDGFHCLVNAHNLTGPNGEGRRTLETVTYSYLGDWIQRQKDDQTTMVEGADARLAAALDLQAQLEKILKGEPPYDLFVRWKPLYEQAVGWNPDINDGVRLNIRPFMNAELRKGGKAGAGILRWKPNIKWGPQPDRGKESESLRPKENFPWFWGCKGGGSEADRTDYTPERAANAAFDGNRWNDLHYSRAVKESARVAAKNRASGSANS